jgi:hypothetical protein
MSNYNQLLFSGGFRGRLHRMRFDWLKKHVNEQDDGFTMFELGCFDCRSLSFLPKPRSYVGADAGWEGGINDAQMSFVNKPWIELVVAQSVHDLAPYEGRRFDYTVAMETLEHIPDAVLKGYLEFLARVTKKRLILTVPVEVGPVFLAKYLAKRTFSHLEGGDTGMYTLKEVYWSTRGRVEHVARYEHKGFDYRRLIAQLSEYFDIVAVEGLPFARFPHASFQVGVVAVPKKGIAA